MRLSTHATFKNVGSNPVTGRFYDFKILASKRDLPNLPKVRYLNLPNFWGEVN